MMTMKELPPDIASKLRKARGDQRTTMVRALDSQGYTQAAIARAVGCTRQNIWQYLQPHGRTPRPSLTSAAAEQILAADRAGDLPTRNRLIRDAIGAGVAPTALSLRLGKSRAFAAMIVKRCRPDAAPAQPIPAATVERLRADALSASRVRWGTPPEHPDRRAAERLVTTVATLYRHNTPPAAIAQAAQTPWPTLRARLARHGQLPIRPGEPPRQPAPAGRNTDE